MIRVAFSLILGLAVCIIACTSRPGLGAKTETTSEAKLIGKWQEVPLTRKKQTLVQYEFLSDGTVIENEKTPAQWWKQQGTGTYKVVDANHIKVELQPAWYFGVVVYEVIWPDKDHVVLKAADEAIPLVRLKPAEAH